MTKRNTKVDNNGEWMTLAQYKNALAEDFGISISHTAISFARDNGKILKKHTKNILGKQCINYTLSVIRLLKNSPKIFPDDFQSLEREFIKNNKIYFPDIDFSDSTEQKKKPKRRAVKDKITRRRNL